MDVQTAKRIVADDQRQSYPEMTDAEAIQHARNVVNPDEINDDDPTARAYRIVLAMQPPAVR